MDDYFAPHQFGPHIVKYHCRHCGTEMPGSRTGGLCWSCESHERNQREADQKATREALAENRRREEDSRAADRVAMELSMIEAQQAMAAEQEKTRRAIADQALRSQLREIAMMRTTDPERAATAMQVLVASTDIYLSDNSIAELIDLLNLKEIFFEAGACVAAKQSAEAVEATLDAAHDCDAELYDYIFAHSEFRARPDFRRFANHAKDYAKRKLKAQQELERRMAELDRERKKLANGSNSGGCSTLLVIIGVVAWFAWEKPSVRHWFKDIFGTDAKIESAPPVSATPAAGSVRARDTASRAGAVRLRRSVLVSVPQGSITVPAQTPVTVISRNASTARVKFGSYEIEIALTDLEPVP